PAVSARVEKSRSDCASMSQIILRTDRSMQCGRIVFYTFCRCMSFHTARVKTGNAQSEHMSSGLPSITYMSEPRRHFRKVPEGDIRSFAAERLGHPSLGRAELSTALKTKFKRAGPRNGSSAAGGGIWPRS